jgi:hypothetical protein
MFGSPIQNSSSLLSVPLASSIFLWCSSACNTPVAQVTGGYLIIKSRHHGKRHITKFGIKSLVDAMVQTAGEAINESSNTSSSICI